MGKKKKILLWIQIITKNNLHKGSKGGNEK